MVLLIGMEVVVRPTAIVKFSTARVPFETMPALEPETTQV
jgi:hypothetical protein